MQMPYVYTYIYIFKLINLKFSWSVLYCWVFFTLQKIWFAKNQNTDSCSCTTALRWMKKHPCPMSFKIQVGIPSQVQENPPKHVIFHNKKSEEVTAQTVNFNHNSEIVLKRQSFLKIYPLTHTKKSRHFFPWTFSSIFPWVHSWDTSSVYPPPSNSHKSRYSSGFPILNME